MNENTKAKLRQGLRIHGTPILVMFVALMIMCVGTRMTGEFRLLLILSSGSMAFLAFAWADVCNLDACTSKIRAGEPLSEKYISRHYKYHAWIGVIFIAFLTIIGGFIAMASLFASGEEGWRVLMFICGLNMLVIAGVTTDTNKLMLKVLDASQEMASHGE